MSGRKLRGRGGATGWGGCMRAAERVYVQQNKHGQNENLKDSGGGARSRTVLSSRNWFQCINS